VLSMAHPLAYQPDQSALQRLIDRKIEPRREADTVAALPAKSARKGLTVVTRKLTALPVISLRFLFPGGSREESPQDYGLAHFFQRTWASGTRSFSSHRLAHTLESLG